MAIWRKIKAPATCCILFVIAFIFLKNGWIIVSDQFPGPEYGLLLFLFPGVMTALLFRDTAIFSTLLGAFAAVPFCFTLRWIYYVRVRPPVQEVAYAASAIFWCVLGAMFVVLATTAYRQYLTNKKGAH
jgi:hypothetical protein